MDGNCSFLMMLLVEEVEAAAFDVGARMGVDADEEEVDKLLMLGFVSLNSGLRCRASLLNLG